MPSVKFAPSETPKLLVDQLPTFVKEVSFSPELEKNTFPGGPRPKPEEAAAALKSFEEHKGQYSSNNSMLTYVDMDGKPHNVPLGAFRSREFNPIEPALQDYYKQRYGEHGDQIHKALNEAG